MRVHDGRQWLTLQDEIGRGGEGVVLAVGGMPHSAAKIYANPPDEERCQKLQCMLDILAEFPQVTDTCAWPERILTDESGQVRGFLMQRLPDQRPVHELYNPEQRKQVYPRATWETLLRAASSCASMFAELHSNGVVVGDVNERNVLVGGDGRLRLVDCDSFQIQRGDSLFLTGVGVVDYTPPELQGADFRAAVRTANHDCFGLAILLFKLVFMGRHPFSGGATGDMATAIANCAFDYPELAQRLKHLVPLAALPGAMRAMFDLAFSHEGADDCRPSAREWVAELDEMAAELQPCPTEANHRVPATLPRCPWCLIEATLHYAYFLREDGERYVSSWAPRFEELLQLRQAMGASAGPPEPASLQPPVLVDTAMQMARRVANSDAPPHTPSWHLRLVGGLAALGGTALITFDEMRLAASLWASGVSAWSAGQAWGRLAARPWHRRIAATSALVDRVTHGGDNWQAEAHQRRNRDRQLLDVFADLCAKHEAVARYRQAELDRLARDVIDEKVREDLERHLLEDADLPAAVVPEKRQALQIRGFLTAADLQRDRLTGLPGMTPPVIDALVQWRQNLEVQLGGYRKPPAKPDQFAAVDINCTVMQTELEQQLAAIIDERRACTAEAEAVLAHMLASYEHDTALLCEQAERLWLDIRGAV